MSVAEMFKGLADAQMSQRLPEPKLGTADFLVNTIRQKKSRNGIDYIKITLTCLRSLEEEGKGNEKGDRCSVALFPGDYFLKEVKSHLYALMCMTPADEEELIEAVVPKNDHPDLDDLQRKNKAWDLLAKQMCAMDEEGNEQQAGLFDGQAVIRIETVVKKGTPTGKFIKNADGEMVEEVGKDFINSYPRAGVPLTDIADVLDEKDIERFFGSVERFGELLAEA